MSEPGSVATGREQRVLQIIETARAKRARFRDKQITLAHGAGGKATQTLIEGLLVPAFTAEGGGCLAALADAGAVEINGTALAMTTDSFVASRCAPPAARSVSWPSTAPSTTLRWRAPGRSRPARTAHASRRENHASGVWRATIATLIS